MARLVTLGGETQDATIEGGGTTTAPGRLGLGRAFSGLVVLAPTTVLGRSYYVRAYFQGTDLTPSVNDQLISVSTSDAHSLAIGLSTTGALAMLQDSVVVGSASAVLNTGQWYMVEFRVKIGTAATDELEWRLDGVQMAVATGLTITDSLITGVSFTTNITGTSGIVYDDIAINDDQGASQNSWPGEGKVVLLLPISDNSRGSWVAGSNTTTATTSLFAAIDNTPPVGTATSNAVTACISNAISGATNPNGDFNMTTYSTAGLVAGDTVSCVQQIIVHGEDAATGTKTGTFAIVSNPSSGTADTIKGPTSSNFGPDAGGAVSAYPTNWIVQRGTVVYSPSVTLGTSPVGRISKSDTGTRAADCCFMGIYVDYVPGVPNTPYRSWVPTLGPILAQ